MDPDVGLKTTVAGTRCFVDWVGMSELRSQNWKVMGTFWGKEDGWLTADRRCFSGIAQVAIATFLLGVLALRATW